MDPLSVAASIVGLLTASAQIATVLDTFRSSYAIAETVYSEIHTFRPVLIRLHDLILGPSVPNIARSSMIDLDQLVIVLTGSVCTFSDLEREVHRLGVAGSPSLRVRMRWTLAQSTIDSLVRQLQNQKASLSLMLAILTCVSHDEAMESMRNLQASVRDLVAINAEMVRRLEASVVGLPTAAVTVSDRVSVIASLQSVNSVRTAFESTLLRTRLYKRAIANNSRLARSLLGPADRTIGWTALTGFSLSEISELSVYSLPVMASDLYNSEPYIAGPSSACFLNAAREGKVEEAAFWIAEGVNLDVLDGNDNFGRTALLLAVEGGHTPMVNLLLDCGMDVNALDGECRSALLHAARYGRANTAATLLKRGADINAKDAYGNTALHVASSRGDTRLVTILLEAGSDIDAKDGWGIWGRTALHLAALGGHRHTISCLLDQGASIEGESQGDQLLRRHGSMEPDISSYILKRMAIVRVQPNDLERRRSW